MLGGRYRLGPVIGRGGMATIHRATDLRQEREVAVKLLRPEVGRDPDLAHRFRREALAATVLRHPNIVACVDAGTEGDQPYLVMELIDGEDLAARLRRGGRLEPTQAARIALDVARALGVAHIRGIVHRDVKPGNILLASDGRAMVTDFGIARLAADAEAASPGTTLGSVHYFSPEQARGLTTSSASDVYGLGLVLYECLTGQRAWAGRTNDDIALARVGAEAPSPRALVPEVPAGLDAIVRRALAPEPGDRFPNGAALATALEGIVAAADRSTSLAATSGPAAPTRPSPATPSRPPPSARPGRVGQARRSAAPTLGVLGLVVAGVTIGAILVSAMPGDGATGLRSPDRPTPPPGTGSALSARPAAGSAAAASPRPASTGQTTPSAPPPASPTEPPPTVPPGEVADLCQIYFGLACGLGPGRYAPSGFEPAFDIELGRGWSNAHHAGDLVTFARKEGLLTFASRVTEVYPGGETSGRLDRAKDLIEAFIVTEGISSTRPAAVRIDGRKGLSIDVATIDSGRVPIFSTASGTYRLEPDRTTRLVAMDAHGGTVLLVIEPADALDLEAILETADVAAGTISWR